MKQAAVKQSTYATLFDVCVAREVAARAAQMNLPRREVRPLDRYPGRRVAADLAAYDAEIESAPAPVEEIVDEPPPAQAAPAANDSDEDDEDF